MINKPSAKLILLFLITPFVIGAPIIFYAEHERQADILHRAQALCNPFPVNHFYLDGEKMRAVCQTDKGLELR